MIFNGDLIEVHGHLLEVNQLGGYLRDVSKPNGILTLWYLNGIELNEPCSRAILNSQRSKLGDDLITLHSFMGILWILVVFT